MTTEDRLRRRRRLMGPNVPTFYDDPVHLVRGEGVWLWDANGKRYLDCYNNTAHVGHCHPAVVAAIAEQAGILNTHTRYLHDEILDYIERLTKTLRHDLSQMILTCTGSEANDIALRMAQAVTGKTGIIATDNTYHGNTLATAQLSTRRPPIGGYPPHVRLVPAPDSVNPVGGTLEGQSQAFADNVARAIRELEAAGHGFSGMMICPVFANEGLPDVGSGFFDPAAKIIRDAGGLILCDEVQPGFGRLGSHFWGHDWLGLAPDVVSIGKPMANGHPVAGVIARPDVMARFREGFGYFNTFGGNPVSCAAASAVLSVIQTEDLQANALRISEQMLSGFASLDSPLIRQVRGRGLFFAIELILPDGAPATTIADQIVEEMKGNGVLIGRIGRSMNTLKLRPPLVFSVENSMQTIDTLQNVLQKVGYGE